MARQGRTQRSSRSEVGRWSGVMFFFQAEDGIRCLTLTGVQTCALPIPLPPRPRRRRLQCHDVRLRVRQGERGPRVTNGFTRRGADFGGDALSGMAVAREPRLRQIGRAAWRERGEISGGARSLKKKKRSRLGRDWIRAASSGRGDEPDAWTDVGRAGSYSRWRQTRNWQWRRLRSSAARPMGVVLDT